MRENFHDCSKMEKLRKGVYWVFRSLEPGMGDFKVICKAGICYRLSRVYDKISWDWWVQQGWGSWNESWQLTILVGLSSKSKYFL